MQATAINETMSAYSDERCTLVIGKDVANRVKLLVTFFRQEGARKAALFTVIG